MNADGPAQTRHSDHPVMWLGASSFLFGVGLGILQPLVVVVIGPGIYAGPSYVGLLFLLCVVLVPVFGLLGMVIRGSRPLSWPIVALSASLAFGMLGGNVLAARLHISFAPPPPLVQSHPTGGGWTATGDMVEGRAQHTATLLKDGRVLVAGGIGSGERITNTAELYDAVTGTWTATGSMLSSLSMHQATLLADGRVLVTTWGGQAELYDPGTGTWRDTAPMLTARAEYAATTLVDGRVLVSGGRNPQIAADQDMAQSEIYDPVSEAWNTAGTMHVLRASHTATLLTDKRVLVAGGQGTGIGSTGAVAFLASAEIFDPVAGTWTVTGSMSTPRSQHAAARLDSGSVVVFGGSVMSGVTDIYDPGTGTWHPGSTVEGWNRPCAIALGGGRVLVMDATGSISLYDPLSTAPHAGATAGHGFDATATLLANGKVLVAGGMFISFGSYGEPSGVLADADLYVPD